MYKLVGTPKTQQWSNQLALKYANMDAVMHERPLRERRMLVYERLMREGKFRPITWASAYCKETGGTYRVNGQHTSRILSTWDTPLELFITTEHYECDTLDDVGRLYGSFDSREASRTANDIYLSFASCIPEFARHDVAQKIITMAVPGICLHLTSLYTRKVALVEGMEPTERPSTSDRAEVLLEHAPFVLWLQELLGGDNRANSHMKRAAVVAAMFGTWCRDSKAATNFWTAVKEETDHPPTKPTRKLAKWLLMNCNQRGQGKGSRLLVTDREVYVKCLRAWIAWRKSDNTNLQYSVNDPLPVIV